MAGPDVSREGARLLEETFERARHHVDQSAYASALQALQGLPMSIRDHSGPGLRLLFGYLLYKASLAEGAEGHFTEAAEALEALAREEPTWTANHPEVLFLIGRARFRAGDFALSVSAIARFVDASRNPVHGEHEMPSVPRDLEEPAVDAASVTDAPGESPKDRHLP